MSFNDILVTVALFGLFAIVWLWIRADARKTDKIIKEGLSGKNSITIEAMPIQLNDARRDFERHQWKLVGSAPLSSGATLYRFVRAVSNAPDAYELHKAWRSEKVKAKPTVKCDFQKKIKAYELRYVDDTRVP